MILGSLLGTGIAAKSEVLVQETRRVTAACCSIPDAPFEVRSAGISKIELEVDAPLNAEADRGPRQRE